MITSTANPQVKAAAALHRRRERDRTGRYLVEGPNAVAEALTDGVVETLYVVDDLADAYGGVNGDVELVVVAEHVLERLADTRTPQGVVAVARRRPAVLDDVVGTGFLVICWEVADPGNLGTIIRTADAAGAAGVVVTRGSVDPWNPKAVRASTGSLTHLPIVVDVDGAEILSACRAAGQRVAALDTAGATSVDEPGALAPPVALVFGNEAHGLPAHLVAEADLTVAVPRYGRAESLNLAAAVAVTVYAAARETHGEPGKGGRA